MRIVCVYADGRLGAEWFQAYRRLKRSLRRGGYDASVELLPETALPADGAAVLIVPEELLELRDRLPGTRVVAARRGELQPSFDGLVAELDADGSLRRAPGSGRTRAVHIGFQAVGERARLAK